MRSYELAELFNMYRIDTNALCEKGKYKEALKKLEEWEKSVKPYLDTCAFTCSDYKEREKFNQCALSDACRCYPLAESAGGKEHYVKLYNNASGEIYSLWFSWKPFINQMIKELQDGRRYIEQQLRMQEEVKAKQKEKKS